MEIDRQEVISYVLHIEIRNKFPSVWTYEKEDGTFWVKIVSKEDRKNLKLGESNKLEEDLVNNLLGFSKLLHYISKSKKTLIGHNCFLDLIKIYNQFLHPIPEKYEEFKRDLNKLFPVIFDTKNICFKTQKKISKIHPELEHVFASSNLNELHQVLGLQICNFITFNISVFS